MRTVTTVYVHSSGARIRTWGDGQKVEGAVLYYNGQWIDILDVLEDAEEILDGLRVELAAQREEAK